MKAQHLLLFVCSLFASCSPHHPAAVAKSDPRFLECQDCSNLEKLYYYADKTFTRHDSLFIVNYRLDTTVVETGIFTYPQHSFPVCTPSELVSLIRQGVQAETDRNHARAISHYRAAIRFYQDDWLKRKSGFENSGFSDLNDYYAANVNVTILVSYAFERLGRLPEALSALLPFLANVEAENSNIQLRYIQLCIKQYGKSATKQALDVSGETVHRIRSEDSPEVYLWRVNVLGADLGVANYNTATLSPSEAQAIICEQPFYAFTK